MRFVIGLILGLAVGMTLIHMNVFGLGDMLAAAAGNAFQTAGTVLLALSPSIITMVGIAIAISCIFR